MRNCSLLLLLIVFVMGCSSTPTEIGNEAVTQMAVTDKVYGEFAGVNDDTVINPASGFKVGHLKQYLDSTWRFENAVAVDSGLLEAGAETKPSSRPRITTH